MKLLEDIAIVLKPQQFEEAKHEFNKVSMALEEAMKKAHSEWVQPFQSGEVDPEKLTSKLEIPLLIRASMNGTVGNRNVASIGAAQSNATGVNRALQAAANASTNLALPGGAMGMNLTFLAGKLEVNFDQSILKLLNEVSYWEKFHGTLIISVLITFHL
jgi:hypothetical protein